MSGVPNFKILTPDGFKPFEGIFRKKAKCLELTFDHKKIVCSTDHRFDENGKEIFAYNLNVGDSVNGHKLLEIKDSDEQFVYSPLNVADGHRYISEDMVHHNCSFIGSSVTLIDGSYLDKMLASEPIRMEDNYSLKVFEDPIPRISVRYGRGLFHRCRKRL